MAASHTALRRAARVAHFGRKAGRAAKRGFTLLEMMVVILIIGILSAALVVAVPDYVDKARMSASEQNMKAMYDFMMMYRQDHDGSFQSDNGQKFLLRLWKDKYMEHTEQNAKRFFSPAMPFNEWVGDPDLDIIEYLDEWDGLAPGHISYAGFDTGGDRAVRRQLNKNPGRTTIMADAGMYHRTALIYLTADSARHRLLASDIEERTGLDLDVDEPLLGAGSELEELSTVTND